MAIDRKRVPAHLHARYGITPRRYTFWVVTALGLAAISLGLLWSIGSGLVQDGKTALVGWQVTGENQVALLWTINRPAGDAVYCVARVQDADRFDVGYARFWISDTSQSTTYRLSLSTTGEVFAVPNPICEAAGWDYLPGPHFRPGILPPAQTGGLAAPWQPDTPAINE